MKSELPNLTFAGVTYGALATPWDLQILLYPGLSAKNIRKSAELIKAGEAGKPQIDRLPLVTAFHQVLAGQLAAGYAQTSVGQAIVRLRMFVAHVDEFNLEFNFSFLEKSFLHWTDRLVHRHRTIKDIAEDSAYQVAAMVAALIDAVLDRPSPLIRLARLKPKVARPRVMGVQADRQSLASTFLFGNMLKDVCDRLTSEVVLQEWLPIVIDIRSGGRIELWSGWHKRRFDDGFKRFQSDGTLRTRSPLANLRIEAEILMFLGQTGMNSTQALKLRLCSFRYVSHIDGYQVGEYKGRRKGAVLFEIYKEYRVHFERYLRWRNELFPKSDLLFPFLNTYGGPESGVRNWRLRPECERLGITFVGPQALRNTRVNWLLRMSSDPGLTAEMAQHTKETLMRVYEQPSLQKAGAEVLRFWAKNDPALAASTPSIAPGLCDGVPTSIDEIPAEATKPDCIRPSGCLWCAHHRDVDEFEYIWGLVCFGVLKEFEVNRRSPAQVAERSAARCAMERIREKLNWFYESNQKRREWVEEAHARIEDGSYHPSWKRLIRQFQPI